MSKYTFEGDIVGISERQKEFVCKVLDDRGFHGGPVTISGVGEAGGNYAANVKRFAIEEDGETFKMIAKIAPADQGLRVLMHPQLMFGNEHVMYTQVLPKFTAMEEEAGIPANERLRYAQCYGTLLEEPHEIILLEDLKVSNFVVLDRLKSLTDQTVKLILRNFAKLHSLSYALKNQEPETYEGFLKSLRNMWTDMHDRPDTEKLVQVLENEILTFLQNEKDRKLIKGRLVNLTPNYKKLMTINEKSKYSVIQQGDCWTNNIMFTVDGERTVECCMIDYQISNHNSPVADLTYMIFNCTDYQSRSTHYHEWIDFYHQELDKRLAKFGLKASLVYPRNQLDSDLMSYGELAFGFSLLLGIATLRENSDAAKFKDAMNSVDGIMEQSKFDNMSEATTGRVSKRFDELIASFLELGYIQ